MTHFNTAVDFLEYGLLLALAIRIVRNWQVGGRTLGSEPEIGIYACLLILNNVLFLLIDDTRLTFNFIHYCAPIAIWISILKGHVGIFQTSLITVLITILLTALPIYFVVNLFYLLAIIAVMYKAYWLSQRRTNDISKSVLYPFIAFDSEREVFEPNAPIS
jgi:hypothetical protein